MKGARRILLILLAAVAIAAAEPACARSDWEGVDRWPTQRVTAPTADEPAVAVHDGYVYVALAQRAEVKIFSILGQSIVQKTLPAGVYRLKLPSRGIYIQRVGSYARRLTV